MVQENHSVLQLLDFQADPVQPFTLLGVCAFGNFSELDEHGFQFLHGVAVFHIMIMLLPVSGDILFFGIQDGGLAPVDKRFNGLSGSHSGKSSFF
jgi:hypothetical protein